MEPEPTVLDSLRKAVEAMPDDVLLRLHLATMLPQAERTRRSGRSARSCSATQATPARSACCGTPGRGLLRPRASRLRVPG